MDGLAMRQAALTVVERIWGAGLKSPPVLDVLLSDGSMLTITVDDVLGLKTYRLTTDATGPAGKPAEYWHLNLEPAVFDGLISEVNESNKQWWAESWS